MLHVYPLSDYGAVEVGEHRFFQLLPGKRERGGALRRSAQCCSCFERRSSGIPVLRPFY
jgi:hypothetical protein